MKKLKTKVKPLNNHILLDLIPAEEKTKGGIILSSSDDVKSERAEVLEVADDVTSIKKGDIIYVKSYTLSPMIIDGDEYGFIKEDEVLAIE